MECVKIKLTKEIIDEVNKFTSSEQLLRSGGISTEALDRAAFGFSDKDIKTLMPNQLKIKWLDDLENVKYEIKHKKLNPMVWAKTINLSEPIEVSYWEDKSHKRGFYIEDGHHRYYAAKVLNKPLNVELTIKVNPIITLGQGLSYDNFHRCIFNQVKNTTESKLFIKQLLREGLK